MGNIESYFDALRMLEPIFWVVGGVLVAYLWNLFFPNNKFLTPVISIGALAIGGLHSLGLMSYRPTECFGGAYIVDPLTACFGALACLFGIILVLMSWSYEDKLGDNVGEFYALLLTTIASIMLLSGTTELILLFVGLETLGIASVLLTGMTKKEKTSNEAALKYLLSTAATTATLLYGLSFLYGITGSTYFADIHQQLLSYSQDPTLLVVLLLVLLISAIGFKLSAVPFHMWTPDVYEGAPTPVTAFLATASKLGGFVVAIRVLQFMLVGVVVDWGLILSVMAALSMVVGNMIALAQNSFKRMLAYSSIAHVGYIIIGLTSFSQDGLRAVVFYLIVYGIMNLGAFAALILFANETGSDNINDFSGLVRKRPYLAIGLSICLLNLAGLPIPPAGFFAKLFVFQSGLEGGAFGIILVILALITSVPAIYYYTRPVIKMLVKEPSTVVNELEPFRKPAPSNQFTAMLAVILCLIGLMATSFNVKSFIDLSDAAISPMVGPPSIGGLPVNPVR
jgi:NAD(P)H-quinone oxidoreductase subunit 2